MNVEISFRELLFFFNIYQHIKTLVISSWKCEALIINWEQKSNYKMDIPKTLTLFPTTGSLSSSTVQLYFDTEIISRQLSLCKFNVIVYF